MRTFEEIKISKSIVLNTLMLITELFAKYCKCTEGKESSVADPDPGSGAFLTSGSGVRDE
jgi:hypothetical protein